MNCKKPGLAWLLASDKLVANKMKNIIPVSQEFQPHFSVYTIQGGCPPSNQVTQQKLDMAEGPSM